MYDSSNALISDINQVFDTKSLPPSVRNRMLLTEQVIDQLITTAVFSPDSRLQEEACVWIRHAAKSLRIVCASIAPLYKAFGREEISGFTVPAINLRTLTYDVAGVILSTAVKKKAGALVFEIARSEMQYTNQSPKEYAIVLLAAAIKHNYTGALFIQGDHFQINHLRFMQNREAEVVEVETLIANSIYEGFLNIDIDASTLVDLTKPTPREQQAENAQTSARLIRIIRSLENTQSPISIGVEIGHIGGKVSTPSDFEAFMDILLALYPDVSLTKISVQTGTEHGGDVQKDGTLSNMHIDFSVLQTIGDLARKKYKLGGAVQHGASTLPLTLFPQFVSAKTLEVHLSTGFQNIVFSHLPETLMHEMYAWISKYCIHDRQPEWSDEQFFYRMRKKALGPFKKQLWALSAEQKAPILTSVQSFVSELFDALKTTNTTQTITRFIPI